MEKRKGWIRGWKKRQLAEAKVNALGSRRLGDVPVFSQVADRNKAIGIGD
jgi:hypothetical protein